MKKFIFIIVFLVLTSHIYSQNRANIKFDSNYTIFINPLKLPGGQIYLGTEFPYNNKLNFAFSIAYKHKFISTFSNQWRCCSYFMYNGIILEPAFYQKYSNKDFFFGLKTKLKYYWYNNGIYDEHYKDGQVLYYTQNEKDFKINFLFIVRNKMVLNKKIYLEEYFGIGIIGTYKLINITRIDRKYGPPIGYTDRLHSEKHLAPATDFGINLVLQLKKH